MPPVKLVRELGLWFGLFCTVIWGGKDCSFSFNFTGSVPVLQKIYRDKLSGKIFLKKGSNVRAVR